MSNETSHTDHTAHPDFAVRAGIAVARSIDAATRAAKSASGTTSRLATAAAEKAKMLAKDEEVRQAVKVGGVGGTTAAVAFGVSEKILSWF